MGLVRKRPSEPADLLIVGLGNPGPEFARTRHNIGYRVTEALARRHAYPRGRRDFHGHYALGSIAGRRVGLLQPTTYMNVSGKSVAAALRALRLRHDALLVVHDEIDFQFGRLQLRHDGGHGGHNGLRSLHELVGADFDRLRLGVGRPASGDPEVVGDYVLGLFDETDDEVRSLVERGADAVEMWVRDGLAGATEAVIADPQ